MPAAIFMILVLVVIFSVTAVYGLVWAIRSGQLRRPGSTSRSIFDEDEPIGRQTDFFPGEAPVNPGPSEASSR